MKPSCTPAQRHTPREFAAALIPPKTHYAAVRIAAGWTAVVTIVFGFLVGLATAAVWPDPGTPTRAGDALLVGPCVVGAVLCWLTALATFSRAAATRTPVEWGSCLSYFPVSFCVLVVAGFATLAPAGLLGLLSWRVWGAETSFWVTATVVACIIPWFLPALAAAPRTLNQGLGFSFAAVAREPGFLLVCFALVLSVPALSWVAPDSLELIVAFIHAIAVTTLLMVCTSTLLRYRGVLRRFPDTKHPMAPELPRQQH